MIVQIEPWIDESEKKYLDQVVNSTFVTEHKLTKAGSQSHLANNLKITFCY